MGREEKEFITVYKIAEGILFVFIYALRGG